MRYLTFIVCLVLLTIASAEIGKNFSKVEESGYLDGISKYTTEVMSSTIGIE